MRQFLFALLMALQVAPAEAAEIIRETQNGWKWQRPEANGSSPPILLSSTATSTPRDPMAFGVSKSGLYNIISTAIGGWNNYTLLYASSTIGGLGDIMLGNDDLGSSGASGFTGVYLEAKAMYNSNQYYNVVTTGYSNSDFGSYLLSINGPGEVTFYPFGVPESPTWVLMIFGVGIVGAALRRSSLSRGANGMTVQLGLDDHSDSKPV